MTDPFQPRMELPLYQVDAFADRPFSGNPAAVCPLPSWLPADLMQAIATENNLAETSFLCGGAGRYGLRWFTPAVEVKLCGHATLAAAFVVFRFLEPGRSALIFDSASGPLRVEKDGEMLRMDFPALPPAAPAPLAEVAAALGARPLEAWTADLHWLAVYSRQEDVERLRPDFRAVAALPTGGVIATAPGRDHDFVSRFFAPAAGIDEDPVTGSAHCTLAPYWALRLGKKDLRARQLSRRGGEILCRDLGARVALAGRAVLYLTGRVSAEALS